MNEIAKATVPPLSTFGRRVVMFRAIIDVGFPHNPTSSFVPARYCMAKRRAFLMSLCVFVGLTGVAAQRGSSGSIQGMWRVTEVKTTGLGAPLGK